MNIHLAYLLAYAVQLPHGSVCTEMLAALPFHSRVQVSVRYIQVIVGGRICPEQNTNNKCSGTPVVALLLFSRPSCLMLIPPVCLYCVGTACSQW
jgi:hypothetical protein